MIALPPYEQAGVQVFLLKWPASLYVTSVILKGILFPSLSALANANTCVTTVSSISHIKVHFSTEINRNVFEHYSLGSVFDTNKSTIKTKTSLTASLFIFLNFHVEFCVLCWNILGLSNISLIYICLPLLSERGITIAVKIDKALFSHIYSEPTECLPQKP